ncbi:MAG TPA: hypothetical protein VE871_16540 [Longimicrobium sp.]|nr:hypothetical protein [Longimicrobium sp.]
MNARRALLLIPLLAAGCATAGPSASSLAPAEGDAPDVRFERVTSRAVVMKVAEPVNAAFLYLRPNGTVVASMVDDRGVQQLPAGSHTIQLGRGGPVARGTALNAAGCSVAANRSRPGIQPAGYAQGGPEGRLLFVERSRATCAQNPDAGAPTLFVLLSAQPLDADVVEEMLVEFNQDYTRIPLDAGQLSSALTERLALVFPGASGVFTRLSNR